MPSETAVTINPPHYPADYIAKETNFWQVTVNNEVVFPRWDKIGFSQFWWDYFCADSKRELVCVGRGGGKGWNLLFKRVSRAFRMYANVKASGIRYTGAQWHLLIVAPTTENFTSTVSKLIEMVPHVPGYAPDGYLNYRFRNSDACDFRLFGNNELLITVLSTYDADVLRGKDADDLLIDEAFMVDREAITDVLIQVVQRQGRPPFGGYFGACSTPDTEDVKDPWFDAACDEADQNKPDITGFFDNFTLYEADFTANPFMTDDLYGQILREAILNLKKFQRERLAIRGIKIKTGDLPSRIYTRGMVEACWYMEEPAPPKRPAAALDLAFGAEDSLARIWYDELTGTVVDLEIWLPREQREMGITPKAYEAGMVDMFNTTGARYPGVNIVYDAGSENHQPVEHLVPRHLRTNGVKKNQHKKYGLVKLLEERFALVENGRNTSLRMPHPDAPWLTEKQRDNFKRLYREIEEFEVVYYKPTEHSEIRVRCGKPDGGTDDAIDALLLLMTLSKPVRQSGQAPLRRMRR